MPAFFCLTFFCLKFLTEKFQTKFQQMLTHFQQTCVLALPTPGDYFQATRVTIDSFQCPNNAVQDESIFINSCGIIELRSCEPFSLSVFVDSHKHTNNSICPVYVTF